MNILIKNGAVVPLTADRPGVLNPGYVWIEGDRIGQVGAGAPPPELEQAAEQVIDASQKAVIPGMVNAHSHLFQTFIRGMADDKTLLPWLKAAIWPVGAVMGEEEAYLSGLLGLVENIRSGATAVIDNQYLHTDRRSDDAFCRAAQEVGVRFRIARGWADTNYHPVFMETPDQILEAMTHLYETWHNQANGRIQVEFGPLIPWGCSAETLQRTVALARQWGVGTHLHTAETREEVQMSLDATGLRHVHWLEQLGVLGPDVQLVHCVWLDDSEIERIAATGTVVVHCPVSNMYLASGVAPVLKMLAQGVPVALASDGPGSNNSQDMLETLKFTACLHKVHNLDATALLPEQVLEMACLGGARAFGQADLGRLQPGYKADVVIVDLDSPLMQPVWSAVSALVYNANGGDVDTVIVDGQVLMQDKHITCLDEKALLQECRQAAGRLLERAGIQI
ncbi:MAG: amidohydrolase [Chloroflexi bacterium]|jgi:5-methylthioadenosine/S-adenosylhomocysteine deaminase|nr:amidohydrolase [Anaerolineaceae bacterium]NMB90930.1 amidohydrolase [Chloroflexota bacterium]